MAATQIGADTLLGATPIDVTVGADYIVESVTENTYEIPQEDVMDANGARAVRVIYQKIPTSTLTLICKAGADPLTDFPAGQLMPGTTWFVRSAPVTKTKNPWRVELDVIDYSLAVVP
jgi:hypothetical protein